LGAVRYAAILGETKVSEGLSGPFAKDGNAGDDAEYLSRSASFIGDICIAHTLQKRTIGAKNANTARVAMLGQDVV